MLMLIVILALIFVLGWPLEWVPIVLIVVPIVLPIVQAAGIDLIWFCTLVAVTLQTAWLSPPVALSAYFLKGVVPQWELKDIYAGMVQFMILQLVGGGAAADLPEAGHLAAGAELRPRAPSATIGATMHTTPRIPGQRFLHSPGPTRLPDEVLHAMGRQPMDLADPRLDPIIAACEAGLKRLLHTDQSDVLMYAANGHGAWEAVIVNLLGPGRAALIPGTGHFSESWAVQTEALGCKVVRTPWVEGLPIDVAAVEQALRDDSAARDRRRVRGAHRHRQRRDQRPAGAARGHRCQRPPGAVRRRRGGLAGRGALRHGCAACRRGRSARRRRA